MGGESSDYPIVPLKPGNSPHEDPLEGRGAEWQLQLLRSCSNVISELKERKMAKGPTSAEISTKLQRIAEQAKAVPEMVFRNLAHHIDPGFLREAYRQIRKNGAPGVDGQTRDSYEANLDMNLQSLWERMKSGCYKAPPVKRVYIPKGDKSDEVRPIGIPTLEDKIAQKSVAMVLEAIYEQDFLNCSFGFRPGRSAHQALQVLWDRTMDMNGGWVLDVDIKGFFDNVDHRHLRDILDLRVQDRGLRRMTGKWLKAGVLDGKNLSFPDLGTPQGGVISPILANIYLHEVVDKWFHETVQPRLYGAAFMVRYADDLVMVFSSEKDALRVKSALTKRCARFGLELHPEKTRLLHFQRPTKTEKKSDAETFDFLGFTHCWKKSRKGFWFVKRRTRKARLRRAIVAIETWCKKNRSRLKVKQQHQMLCKKIQGHYNYYGITGNYEGLMRFYRASVRSWRKWLDRRSRKANVTWNKMKRILRVYPLPEPRIVRSVYVR